MPDLTPFIGDHNKDELSPPDFLKQLRNLMRCLGITNDAEKIATMGDYFKDKSIADKLLKAIPHGDPALTSFATLSAVFEACFPSVQEVVKSPEQLEFELFRMRMSMDELAHEYIDVKGVNVYMNIDFANRVEDTAREAGADAHTTRLWEFRSKLPAVIQEHVSEHPADWKTAAAEIRAVSQAAIKSAVKMYLEQKAMEDKVAHIAFQLKRTRVAPPAPVYRPPQSTAPPAATSPAAPIPPLTQNAPTGQQRGNKPCMPRAPPTEAEKGAVQVYAANITCWNALNGMTPAPNLKLEAIGYPLSPGSSPPCTDDCYGCGRATIPAHCRGPDCGGRTIPLTKSTFRSICGSWFGPHSTMPAPVNVIGVWWEEGATDPQDFQAGLTE
ncbi:hypothetical protein C8R44DRAFT_734087 [Mycena epipterygia]|nr:hypothetical protein C8R44DRAFT_734087 [Mycena epipterygia]